jgi:hypothetical protein
MSKAAVLKKVNTFAVFVVGALLALPAAAQEFQYVTTYRGLGALVASAVGPGPAPGSQRLYLSYLYLDHTIDVVAVDPITGAHQVFPNPAPTESGARSMAAGPDGNLYLGTLPHAHFLKLDPRRGKLIDLGRPSETEEYIWDVAFASDRKLYGATYPGAKLVRYDPASGRMDDLGRMDPVEQYAHYVAGSRDGFVYVGIGTSKANIAAYEISTGIHREILPPAFQTVGQALVYASRDGNVYGRLGNQHFRLEGFTARPVPENEASPPVDKQALRDASTVSTSGRTIRVTAPSGETTERRFEYTGNLLNIFRVAFGPDRRLYGSSILPIHFLRLDADRAVLRDVGDLGAGEIYSFLAHEDRLLAAAYSGLAPLYVFNPAKPFRETGESKNPELVNFADSDHGWRPQAMIAGPEDNVYIGAVSGYGKLGGPLLTWNVNTSKIHTYPQLVEDQSVVTLAAWKNLIAGGTTIGGGGGSHPTQKEAKIFLWDPRTRRKTFEAVPVAGAASITDLIAAPNGLIYGIASGSSSPTAVVFAFDPEKKVVVSHRSAPFTRAIYNAIGVTHHGDLLGLASNGIFRIDPSTHDVSMMAQSPKTITGGFAMNGREIYFACGAELWRFDLPSH